MPARSAAADDRQKARSNVGFPLTVSVSAPLVFATVVRITYLPADETSAAPADNMADVALPPLPAPTNPNPNQASRAVIRPYTPYKFTWNPVAGADYYRLKLYRYGSSESLLDENFISSNTLELDMADYPDGYYQWSIQAYANESEKGSRSNGLLTESNF